MERKALERGGKVLNVRLDAEQPAILEHPLADKCQAQPMTILHSRFSYVEAASSAFSRFLSNLPLGDRGSADRTMIR